MGDPGTVFWGRRRPAFPSLPESDDPQALQPPPRRRLEMGRSQGLRAGRATPAEAQVQLTRGLTPSEGKGHPLPCCLPAATTPGPGLGPQQLASLPEPPRSPAEPRGGPRPALQRGGAGLRAFVPLFMHSFMHSSVPFGADRTQEAERGTRSLVRKRGAQTGAAGPVTTNCASLTERSIRQSGHRCPRQPWPADRV